MITIFDMMHMIIFIGANYIIYFYYSKIVIELVFLHIYLGGPEKDRFGYTWCHLVSVI